MTRLYRGANVLVIAALLASLWFEAHRFLFVFTTRGPGLEAARSAARFMPEDEEVWLRLAALDSIHREPYLRKAAELNPSDAQPWLQLGVMAELRGKPDEAASDLLRANQLDQQAGPAWALADLYFRQGNPQAFLQWGNRYRQMADGAAGPLFRLAWSRNPNAGAMLREFGPMTCQELFEMDNFVGPRGTPADILALDQRLTSCSGDGTVRKMAEDVSRLLSEDQPQLALHVWNLLEGHGMQPNAAAVIHNADFKSPLGEPGFNWQVNRTPGIQVRQSPTRQAIEFVLDGSEPEVSTLLYQPIVLTGGDRYNLTSRLVPEDGPAHGFGWRVVELSTGKTLLAEPAPEADKAAGLASWTFQAPTSPRTLVLAFTYVRPTGETVNSGSLMLSQVSLRAAQASDTAAVTNPEPRQEAQALNHQKMMAVFR